MRLKNLLQGNTLCQQYYDTNLKYLDFFVENIEPQTFDLKDGVHHVVVITGCEKTNSIHIRNYEVESPDIKLIEKNTDVLYNELNNDNNNWLFFI